MSRRMRFISLTALACVAYVSSHQSLAAETPAATANRTSLSPGLIDVRMSRVFILGRDDAGEVHNPAVGKGNYEWTEIKQAITAPKEAAHVALFLGMRPAKGIVHFDDINVKTRPGEMMRRGG